MQNSRFTIYTAPPPWWHGLPMMGFPRWKRTCLWRGLRSLKAYFKRQPIGGHSAVTRSLLTGLRQNGVRFSYNPSFLPSNTVFVLAGLDTLQFAIEQKRMGRIKFLAAGPNICVLPSLCNNLIADEAVDLCVVNSEWTRQLYAEDCPSLSDRLVVWASGVDAVFWERQALPQPGHVLLYIKSSHASVDTVKDVVDKLGMTTTSIYYSDKYSPNTFKALLEASECMIYLGDFESQGIALAEAWAMNVPTFVWQGAEAVWPIPVYASHAPYLSEQTGEFWKNDKELEMKLAAFLSNRERYFPRQYVLDTMTDALSAEMAIYLIKRRKKIMQ